MSTNDKNIYLIDGNALCYRAFYAIQDLATTKGEPTNAIYGFINIIRKIRKQYDPKRMVIVFDSPGTTVRHEKYKEYKIHRKPMPEDLVSQFSGIRAVVEAMKISVCNLEGYEADDIIATIAEHSKKNGLEVVIVTSDKDALQLVDKKITVLSSTSFGDKVYTEKEVREKYGVGPERMTDLMALMGDASDNIPGVKGIGKVGAAKIVKEYGDIDNIYKNLDAITPPGIKKKLTEEEDMARLSKELVVLDREVPVTIDLEATLIPEPDSERLAELYKRFEFKRLLKEVAKKDTVEDSPEICSSPEDLKNILNSSEKSGKVFFDMAFDAGGSKIKGISFFYSPRSIFVSFSDKGPSEAARKIIGEIFEDETVQKIGFDLKPETLALRRENIRIRGKLFDVMIADYLIDPSGSSYDIDEVVMRHLDKNIASEGSDEEKFCMRSRSISELYEELEPVLKDRHLDELFGSVEMPLVGVLAEMEERGVKVDVGHLEKKEKEISKKLKDVTDKIYEVAGEEFNINSPKQLQVILYERLGLPAFKKTKTGISTDESVLQKLSSMHPLPEFLLEYREMNKLKTGYYDSLLALAGANSGSIFAHFNQAVTATGRLSSSDPNLQNIPIKTALGREIRRAFISGGDDRILIKADYSQIELKILAHLSEDKKLIKAFRDGEDVHRVTAGEIFDCKISKVTNEMRSAAKTVNFGIVYGISAFGLAKDLNINVGDAQDYIDLYFRKYEGIKTFIEDTVAETKKKGYVLTLLKRRRYIPEMTSRNEHVRKFAERAAVNTAVQGSAADLIKLAMIDCYKELNDRDVRMIIQVHDELVFDAPEKGIERSVMDVSDIMEKVIKLKVPLTVDIETGTNWMDTEPVKAKA
ncbi:MAG: DNA polymerase I [Candidatus Aadella gelida]|nr:DNA polymerase I [Candidatus Aadella gelida]